MHQSTFTFVKVDEIEIRYRLAFDVRQILKPSVFLRWFLQEISNNYQQFSHQIVQRQNKSCERTEQAGSSIYT